MIGWEEQGFQWRRSDKKNGGGIQFSVYVAQCPCHFPLWQERESGGIKVHCAATQHCAFAWEDGRPRRIMQLHNTVLCWEDGGVEFIVFEKVAVFERVWPSSSLIMRLRCTVLLFEGVWASRCIM